MILKKCVALFSLIFISSSCTDQVKVKRHSFPASTSCTSNAVGVIDTTFGTSGFVEIDDPTTSGTTNGFDYFKAITMTSDGSLYAAGTTMIPPANENKLIAKLGPKGSIDTSFGTNGYVTSGKHDDTLEVFNDIVSQSTPHIVAVGAADSLLPAPVGENNFLFIVTIQLSGFRLKHRLMEMQTLSQHVAV